MNKILLSLLMAGMLCSCNNSQKTEVPTDILVEEVISEIETPKDSVILAIEEKKMSIEKSSQEVDKLLEEIK